MSLYELFSYLDMMLAMPAICLFFFTGLYLTFKTRFAQLHNFSRFIALITRKEQVHQSQGNEKSIHPIQALYAAMATTIGMGNVVGPSIAIMIGGPGALFWLVIYSFFGAITKFAETMFSITFRKKMTDGTLLAGPTQYLRQVHPLMGGIYAILTILLFAGWSGLQTNTIASICALEGIALWKTGLVCAITVFLVIIGGITRVGALASRAVPIMFILYFVGVLTILCKDFSALGKAIQLVFEYAFKSHAAVGGFAGATVFMALKNGVQRNIYITEAGLGTSSIAHGMSDAAIPRNQAILAMYSIIADTFVSCCSGLLVIVTGAWVSGGINNTLVYQLFKSNLPVWGKWIPLCCMILFAVTTIIGNSFNALQSFSYFARSRGIILFSLFLSVIIFAGSLMYVPLIWKLMDVIMIMVAILHLIGLCILSNKYGYLLK